MGPQPSEDLATEDREIARIVEESLADQRQFPRRYRSPAFQGKVRRTYGADTPHPQRDVLLDPSLVTDTLLAHFDLREKVKGRVARTRMHARGIEPLRDIFADVEPIHPYFQTGRHFVEPKTGQLLVTRNQTVGTGLEPQIAVYKDGLYDGARAPLHAKETEHMEVEALGPHTEELDWVMKLITKGWKDLSPEKRTELNSRLVAALDEISSAAILIVKREARELLLNSLNFKDSLDRINPQASEAKIHAAVRRIRMRLRSALDIEAYMAGDNRDLQTVISENERRVARVMKELEPLTKDPLFRGKEAAAAELQLTNVDQAGTSPEKLERQLEILIGHLEPLKARPFNTYKDALQTLLTEVQEKIHKIPGARQPQRLRNDARQTVVKAWVVCKFFEAQRRLEHLHLRITEQKGIHPRETRENLEELEKFAATYQVEPNLIIKQFQPAWLQLRGHLRELIECLKERDRKKFLEKLKSFDIRQTVEELVPVPVESR